MSGRTIIDTFERLVGRLYVPKLGLDCVAQRDGTFDIALSFQYCKRATLAANRRCPEGRSESCRVGGGTTKRLALNKDLKSGSFDRQRKVKLSTR